MTPYEAYYSKKPNSNAKGDMTISHQECLSPISRELQILHQYFQIVKVQLHLERIQSFMIEPNILKFNIIMSKKECKLEI
jgi:hypothetical protein